MLQEAKQELADARRLDPRDPRIALLERRLAVANAPKESPPSPVASKPHDDNASQDELEQLAASVKDLPPGAVERFTRKVQPLLVNSCTTSGCHQAGSTQDYQLDRAVLHGLANRRITLRNLVATLELVDRDSPQDSALVTIPRRKHGGMDHPIFSSRQETQLTQIIDWVELVAPQGAGTNPSIAKTAKQAPPIKPIEPFGSPEYDLPPSRFLNRDVVQADFADPQQQAELPKSNVKFGADVKPAWQPKDEFDPEIFNRQTSAVSAQSATTAVGPPVAH